MYTRREYNCLEFRFSIPTDVFFNRVAIWEFQIISIICFFIIFSQKGGSTYIGCYHLKSEKLLKPNSSLILLQDLTFPLLSNNWQALSEKQRKILDFFSIKICLLNHRKVDKMQEDSSEKAKKSQSIAAKYFYKTREI